MEISVILFSFTHGNCCSEIPQHHWITTQERHLLYQREATSRCDWSQKRERPHEPNNLTKRKTTIDWLSGQVYRHLGIHVLPDHICQNGQLCWSGELDRPHQWPARDQLYKNRSSRKIDSRRLFSREYDFRKTFSLTENQFSGKIYFYTIHPWFGHCNNRHPRNG